MSSYLNAHHSFISDTVRRTQHNREKKTQANKANTMLRSVEPRTSTTKVHTLLGWALETHSTCNVLLGWAFGNTIVPHLSFLQNLNRQYMPIFAAMGRLTHRTFDVLLSWAFNHNGAHLSFLRSFKGHSKLYFVCWEHDTCISLLHSLRCFGLCFELSRLHSKSLIVRASLWWPNFARLRSRLGGNMCL